MAGVERGGIDTADENDETENGGEGDRVKQDLHKRCACFDMMRGTGEGIGKVAVAVTVEIRAVTVRAEMHTECPEEKVEGDVPFTEVLNEEHNYLVLYFDNEVDWLQAKTLFGCKSVKCLSTRSDGSIPKGREKYAVGRVLNGPNAINQILNHKEEKK